jgi:hypothetical protein
VVIPQFMPDINQTEKPMGKLLPLNVKAHYAAMAGFLPAIHRAAAIIEV